MDFAKKKVVLSFMKKYKKSYAIDAATYCKKNTVFWNTSA